MSVEITDISVPNVTNRKHFHSKLNNLCVHFLRAEPECQLMMKGRHMMEVHNPHMMEDSYDSTIRQQIPSKKKTVHLRFQDITGFRDSLDSSVLYFTSSFPAFFTP